MPRSLFLISMIIFLAGSQLIAQQLPVFTQYREAHALLNPSMLSGNYLKYENNLNFGLLYRSQWTQIKGAPQTFLLTQEYLNEDYNFLLGASISGDQTGPLGQTGAYIRGAYLIRFDRRTWLSAGISAGGLQYRVNGAELDFNEPGDIGERSISTLSSDFAFGATFYYQTRNSTYYYAGLAVPQTFGFNLAFRNDDNQIDIERIRHYYALLGSAFNLSDDNWLEISSWIKHVPNIPLHIDVNLRYEYDRLCWIGIGGASAGTAHLEAGFFLPMVKGDLLLGYGYDQYFRTYGPDFGGAHEFRLGYSFW